MLLHTTRAPKPRWRVLRLFLVLALVLAAEPVRADPISAADFEALKEMVRKQGEAIQKLTGQVKDLQEAHAQDQEIHQKDQEQIQKLSVVTNISPASVTNVQEIAAAAESQPVPRVPIDEATVNHNFIIAGDAEFQFAKSRGTPGAFWLADFAPIFLYRGGDDILFEAGFDFILQNNAPASPGYTTTVNLSFAQLDYVINDYLTLAVGNLLLPLGTYSQRAAGWLNKFPDDPLARDLVPGSGVGAELLGAVPIGQEGKLFNYALYGFDGPSSVDGSGKAGSLDLGGNVGLRSDNAVANLSGSPSGGGRIGFFYPYRPHYDFELGLSGESGQWSAQHLWSAGVVDAAIHLGSYIEAKGEFLKTWYGSDDFGRVQAQGWWGQIGYKLAGISEALPIIDNLEIVGRYDFIHDGLGLHTERYSAGLIYYLTNTLLAEGDYEFVHGNDPSELDRFILQLSYGF